MTNKELDDTVIADRFSTPLWERETDEQKEGDNIPAKIDQGWHGLKYKDTGDASESAR